MAPKRKAETLALKSIWDESLVREIIDNEKHRTRMWLWLINNPDKDICDIPFEKWLVKKAAYTSIRRDFLKFTTKIVEKNESARGDTTKLLIELQDGHRIETVIMIHVSHATVCVSSQIGCQMGCR
jgi:adenine C2-methylase RlmN of 23S rRNA A2503 and tRNA A37